MRRLILFVAAALVAAALIPAAAGAATASDCGWAPPKAQQYHQAWLGEWPGYSVLYSSWYADYPAGSQSYGCAVRTKGAAYKAVWSIYIAGSYPNLYVASYRLACYAAASDYAACGGF